MYFISNAKLHNLVESGSKKNIQDHGSLEKGSVTSIANESGFYKYFVSLDNSVWVSVELNNIFHLINNYLLFLFYPFFLSLYFVFYFCRRYQILSPWMLLKRYVTIRYYAIRYVFIGYVHTVLLIRCYSWGMFS